MMKAEQRMYLRLIDANLNRCREGLRVIEDTARYVLGNNGVYRAARKLRHRVDLLTRDVYPQLLAQRDAVQDAGRLLAEGKRSALSSVIAANFRRAQEALRVLEEYSRLIAPDAGPEFKRIRYAVYTLEKKVMICRK